MAGRAVIPEPNWSNRTLFHGDNLEFLRGMNSESVHLIATDPPFNKGKDFHATPDSLSDGAKFQDRWSWADDVEGEWIDQIQDDWPAVWEVIDAARAAWGDDMGAFLCFMGVRLIEMRRILREDGSLYLHCDPTASHYLKVLLDAVFERKNCRNEIIWSYDGPQRRSRRNFSTKHDNILRYSKTEKYYGNTRDTIIVEREDYKKHEDGRYYYDLPKGDYTPESIERLKAEERIRYTRNGKIRVMYFLEQDDHGNLLREKTLPSVWTDIGSLGAINSSEKQGYPTQKPLALYERIIKASSNEGDIVLDPFCGCATTPIAAERLGRQWVGIDIWDSAYETVVKRLQEEGFSVPDSSSDRLLTFGDVTWSATPPVRTDAGETAAPFIQVTERYAEPDGPRMSRAEMMEHLLRQHGTKCQGCDRVFDDSRYLELDHNTPRADGGLNHITNRVLLCGPCNRLKAHVYTLSGLRAQNRKLGYMQ